MKPKPPLADSDLLWLDGFESLARCALETLRSIRTGDPMADPARVAVLPPETREYYQTQRDPDTITTLRFMGDQFGRCVEAIGKQLHDFGTDRDWECVIEDRAEPGWLLAFASWYRESMLQFLEVYRLFHSEKDAISLLQLRLIAAKLEPLPLRISREAAVVRAQWSIAPSMRPVSASSATIELDLPKRALVDPRSGASLHLTDERAQVLFHLARARGRVLSASDISRRACEDGLNAKAVIHRMRDSARIREFLGGADLVVSSPDGYRLRVRLKVRGREPSWEKHDTQ